MKLRHVLFGVLAVSSSAVWAGNADHPGMGLGAAQPAAQNVSRSPQWRVYRFLKDGIEYVQINDFNGQVHMGFGTANGLVLVLPMGSDAAHVSTPDAPLGVPVTGGELVYQDARTKVTVGVNNTGHYVWTVAAGTNGGQATATDTSQCDPDSCPINRITPSNSSLQSPADNSSLQCDPDSCPINRLPSAASSMPSAASGDTPQCDPNSCPINRITSQ